VSGQSPLHSAGLAINRGLPGLMRGQRPGLAPVPRQEDRGYRPPPVGGPRFIGVSQMTERNTFVSVVTLPLPSGWLPGDLLLLGINAGPKNIVSHPSGWTLLHNGRGSGTGVDSNVYVYRKVAASGEPDPAATLDAPDRHAATVLAYRDYELGGSSAINVNTAGDMYSWPSPTIPVGEGRWVVTFYGGSLGVSGTELFLPPELEARDNVGFGFVNLIAGDEAYPAGGTSLARTATSSQPASWVSVVVAI